MQVVMLGVLAAVGGFLVAASGLMPIKASSGHWPITAWFLDFSMSRSVSTHTLGMDAPDLTDPGLLLKGAGHYETGCFPCHGSPEMTQPRIARAMTPHPPYLPPAIHGWEPEELFYIVKHGVKFTGMPAWPTQQRDDEVWAMVAFLRELPELDAQEYRQLVSGGSEVSEEDAPIHGLTGPEPVRRVITEICQRCHGANGEGRGAGAFPRLAGQKRVYLEASLQAYTGDRRHSGIMGPIAAGLRDDEIRGVARYYSELITTEPLAIPDTSDADLERGEAIALKGIPDKRVAVCAECHGPGDNQRNANYPTLGGQCADYLVLQLKLFKKRQRGGSSYAHLMHSVADGLTSQQMRDVALYYQSLPVAQQ
jgi:cytochrome c553